MSENSFKRCPRLLYKNIKLKTHTSIVDEIALFIHYECTVYLCGGPQSKNRFHLVGSNFFCMPSRILDFSRVGSWDERRRGREKLCSMSRERCCSGRWWYDNNVMRRVALLGSYFFLSAVIIVLLLSRRLCEILFYTLRFPAEKLQPWRQVLSGTSHCFWYSRKCDTNRSSDTNQPQKWATVSGHLEWS